MSVDNDNKALPVTDANRNPWYVLMTLHEKPESNRRVWNAWIGQALSEEEKNAISELSAIDVQELSAWSSISDNVLNAHRLAWQKRNPNNEYRQLPDPRFDIDFSQTDFTRNSPFNVEGMVFICSLFRDSLFSAYCNFSGAFFCRHVDFTGAKFNVGASFDSTVFRSGVSFCKANFIGNARFHDTKFVSKTNSVNFSKAEFGHSIYRDMRENGEKFDDAEWGTTEFRRTKFNYFTLFTDTKFYENLEFTQNVSNGNVSFANASFTGQAKFEQTTFNGGVSFYDATFASTTYFFGGTFNGHAGFEKANFMSECGFNSSTFNQVAQFGKAIFHDYVNFQSVTFSGRSYFVGTCFGHRESSTICQANFTDAVFEQPVNFREAHFRTHYPILSGTLLHERSIFSADAGLWPTAVKKGDKVVGWQGNLDHGDQSLTVARESCAVIRHCMAKQGLPEAAHFFFRREMRFAMREATLLQQIPYRLFWSLSDFGNSILRPTVGLFVVFCIFGFIFCVCTSTGFANCPGPFEHSLLNTFSFIGSVRQYFPNCSSDISPILSSIQKIISYILLFLLALGLRQRFRLRS